ncbi:Uncharacterised protein [Bordetella pertussis]|nr:Uncharacterised protein [Bordetella pertussis]CPK86364.1 Uncharacterised protein [Bordetella pertussis]
MTPPRASAWAHLLSRVALSRRGRATTTSVSASAWSRAWSASRASISPPLLPGLPVGIFSSSRRRSPNSETLCVAAATALQSLRASMTMEVRSV